MPSPASQMFTVPDMDCQGCVRSIEAAVHRLDPRAEITADLAAKHVRISSDAAQDFAQAITAAGFTVSPA